MSEQERFEAQGRAYAALKKAKSNVATISATLDAYRKDVEETARSLGRLIQTPSNPGASADLTNKLRASDPGKFIELAEELHTEAVTVRDLQDKVDNF
jgi:hypothetical protein